MRGFFKFLSRNKLYTLIEIVGLTVALAFVIFMGTYTDQQFGVANENPESECLYILGMPEIPGLTFGFNDALEGKFPEIVKTAKYCQQNEAYALFNGKTDHVQLKYIAVDKNFIEMFPQYFIEGTASTFNDVSNVFVSERFANILKQNGENVIGKIIEFDNEKYKVAGIAKNFDNTIFPNVDLIINEKHPKFYYNSPKVNRFDHFGSTVPIIKIADETDIMQLQSKLGQLCKEIYPDTYGTYFFKNIRLTRMDKIFFDTTMDASILKEYFKTGNYKTMMVLFGVALLLLVTALFNFINLNAALAGKRAKEIASRRLLGASKGAVYGRYIGESLIITSVCTILAIILAIWVAPMLNTLVGANVPTTISFSPKYIFGYLLLIAVVGTSSALIPAFMASRYKPIDVVNGTYRADRKRIFSKIFIVIQGTLAVFMISMSVMMGTQFRKSLQRPMNADIQNKYYMAYNLFFKPERTPDILNRFKSLPCVKNIGCALGAPGAPTGGQFSTTTTGEEILYKVFYIDTTSFNMLKLNILENFNTPINYGVWFGETAFKATGLDSEHYDISNLLAKHSGWCTHTAGIIKDIPINISNLGTADELMIVSVIPPENYNAGWLIETIGDHREAKQQIGALADTFVKEVTGVAHEPIINGYLTDMVREGLKKSENEMKLANVFMLLIVIIALLGLVAMSVYDAHEHANDIAIRKVYGSTVPGEVKRGVAVYMMLIATACIVAIPMAVWATGKYLEQFISKIDNYFWIFIVAIIITIIVSFVSIIWQIMTAARTNPATILRKE